MQHAVLAAEDRSFYDHGGVSPLGIGRAVWNNLTGGSTQGGSTITQQYAKNAYLTQERSWDRKVKEALLAFKLETVVSKDEILGNYLNTIYFGRGAYGIEAASIAYFGVPASELTYEQGAVLAAIIKSPSGLAPEKDLAGLEARWTYVLDGMVEQGWLTPKQRRNAEFPEDQEAEGEGPTRRPDRVHAHDGRAAAGRPRLRRGGDPARWAADHLDLRPDRAAGRHRRGAKGRTDVGNRRPAHRPRRRAARHR